MRSSHMSLLSESDLKQIHAAALEVLSKTGIRFNHSGAIKIFQEAGLKIDNNNIVYFPAEIVEDAVKKVPSEWSRVPISSAHREVKMGQGMLSMSPGSTVLNVMDLHTGKKRPGTVRDIVDFARLGDALPDFYLGNGVVWAQDCPASIFHAVYFEAVVKNCGKPHPGGDILSPQIGEDLMLLSEIVLGGKEAMKEKKTFAFSGCPTNALEWGEPVEAFLWAAKYGMPSNILCTPFAGSVCPVTLAGSLVQTNAETLSIVVLTQLINPGAPVIYAPYPGIMDMKFGNHSWGCPEAALMSAAFAQLSRWYGIPCDTIAGAADSKLPDAQAAMEKMMVVSMPAMAGSDSVTLFGGLLELDDSACYAQLVIDNEIAGNILRLREGIEINDETLAVDAIARVGHGGNYMADEHTFAHYRKEHYSPQLSDRSAPEIWKSKGGKDMAQRAREKAKLILDSHCPEHLDKNIAKELEKAVKHICKREGHQYKRIPFGKELMDSKWQYSDTESSLV